MPGREGGHVQLVASENRQCVTVAFRKNTEPGW
jgi:hypothetical protein